MSYDVNKREIIRCYYLEDDHSGKGKIKRPLPFHFVRDENALSFDIEPTNLEGASDSTQSSHHGRYTRIVSEEVYDSKPAWMSNVTDFGWV